MKLSVLVVSVALFLSACGKVQDTAPQPHGSGTMQNQVAAIKACMEQGLSEETCASVHQQMVSGTLAGSPSMAVCEAQHGVGHCGSVPVTRPNGTSDSIILPLVAGAALGYIAHSMLSSNSMPAGAVAPTRAWASNPPAVYQQAAAEARSKNAFAPQSATKGQEKSFAVKDSYSQKTVTSNGKGVSGTNMVPTPQPATPGAVKPQPAKQTQGAGQQQSVQTQKSSVEYKPPTTGYAQQSRPASPSPSPSYRYSTSPSPSRSSGRR